MSNSSFYGGKQGFSFVIVKSFDSKAQMIENFQRGGSYTEVHYDEYVLINTENKNDPDNGGVYRRGYDYLNDLGGAIYIGSIVGPAGPAPMLEMGTVEEIKNKQPADGKFVSGEGSYSLQAGNLIPGKNEDGSFNDSIKWAYCSIRDANGEDTTAYIGFQFPYLVIDISGSSVDPYYNRSDDTENFRNLNLLDRIDDKTHPYYESWHINVPKGIHGADSSNFRVVAAQNIIEDYPNKSDDIAHSRKILVYDYTSYDKISKANGGEKKSLYLGDYNMIENIFLNEEGTLTIQYTHNDDSVFNKIFKWIQGINIDEDGTITINYNNGTKDTIPDKIRWIQEIYFQEENADGEKENQFHIVYNTGEDVPIYNVIKYIDNVYIDDNDETNLNCDYKFHIVYNTGEDVEVGMPTNYIEEVQIDKNTFHLLMYYSNKNIRQTFIDAGLAKTYNGKTGWLDLGSVRSDNGVLIGLNIDPSESSSSDINNISNAISFLNRRYPEGLTETRYYGKIVTIGNSEVNKRFYAFDYEYKPGTTTYKGWYYLGTFDNTSAWTIVGKETDADIENKKNKLISGGVWFVVEGNNG